MPRSLSEPPSLESGDRLSRAEFHARYGARPDIKKAELVFGVVYVASPVRHRQHGRPHALLVGWLTTYSASTPGTDMTDNATVVLPDETELQPDGALFYEGSAVQEDNGGYLVGAPELIIEVAASSASYDLHDKLRAYEQAGVREYIVFRTVDPAVDWFRWQEGRFVRIEPDADGVIESSVFPGLRLDVPALLAGDKARVLAALR